MAGACSNYELGRMRVDGFARGFVNANYFKNLAISQLNLSNPLSIANQLERTAVRFWPDLLLARRRRAASTTCSFRF